MDFFLPLQTYQKKYKYKYMALYQALKDTMKAGLNFSMNGLLRCVVQEGCIGVIQLHSFLAKSDPLLAWVYKTNKIELTEKKEYLDIGDEVALCQGTLFNLMNAVC